MKRHWGITVLAVLAYIGAVVSLVGGLFLLFGASIFTGLLNQYPIFATLAGLGFILLGILLIALSIIDYYVGRGLLEGQNWARVAIMVFMALGIISSLKPFNILSIIIDALIIWYLGFYKPAVKYFQ